VDLHVLLGEDLDDTCKVAVNDTGCKSWNYSHKLELFTGGKRACFPDLDCSGTWSVSFENDKRSFTYGPLEKNVYEPLYEEVG